MSMIHIRPTTEKDLPAIIQIHKETFTRQTQSKEWITCNFQAAPRIQMFVAEQNNSILGYIQWIQKSGFRQEVVLELEQIAVATTHQKQGIGTQLITESYAQIAQQFKAENRTIKSILVSTRTDNAAQELYKKTLGVSPTAVVKNLYSADEVFLTKRYT